jgi:hypothetical protein
VILWHAGVAAALVYVTLGRSRIDYRFILAGAVLPDLIDGLLRLSGAIDSASGRGPAHSLITVIAEGVLIILLFRGERRLAVFGIAVGWLTHLAADGMWDAPKTLLWPLFGGDFEASPAEPYSWDVLRFWAHPTTWLAELAGAALLIWFVVAFRLHDPTRLERFRTDGHLRP